MHKKEKNMQKVRHTKKMATVIALTLAFTAMVGNQMHSIKSGTLSVDTFGNSGSGGENYNEDFKGDRTFPGGEYNGEYENKGLWEDEGFKKIIDPIHKESDDGSRSIIDPIHNPDPKGIIDPIHNPTESRSFDDQNANYDLDENGNKIYKTVGDKTPWPEDKKDDFKPDNSANLAKTVSEMERSLNEHRERDWDRFKRTIDRELKHLQRFLSKTDSPDVKASLNGAISQLNQLSKEADKFSASLLKDKSIAQQALDGLKANPSATWEDTSKAWNDFSRLEIYWPMRESLEVRVMVEEMMRGVWELKMKLGSLGNESALNKVNAQADKFLKLRQKAGDLYFKVAREVERLRILDGSQIKGEMDNLRDMSEDVRDTRDDIQWAMEDFWQSNPWDSVREAEEGKHKLDFVAKLLKEIDRTKQDMAKIASVLDAVKAALPSLGEEKVAVEKAINGLADLHSKSLSVLANMETALGKSNVKPEDVEESWNMLDNIGNAAGNHLGILMRFKHKFSQDVRDLIMSLEDTGGNDDYLDVYNDLGNNDKEELKRKIRAEVLQEVTRQLTGDVMAKVAEYIGDDAAGKIMSQIVNNIDIFGERGNKMLSDSAAVNDVVSEVNFNKVGGNVKNLASKTKKMMIVGDVKAELEQAWKDLRTAADSGDTSNVAALEAKIDGLLRKNEELSFKGKDAYQFADVRADKEDWFFRSVMSMKEQGIVSGYKDAQGNPTGEFGPGNNVTVAEALKMALGAANVPVAPQGSGGHWAISSGYVGAAQNVGLAGLVDLSNLNKPASREDVAVITAKAFGLDTSAGYKNAFTDYNGDKGAFVQATYDSGIFTGEGATGKFNGHAPINRASIAKVINAAIEVKKTDDVGTELDNFKLK